MPAVYPAYWYSLSTRYGHITLDLRHQVCDQEDLCSSPQISDLRSQMSNLAAKTMGLLLFGVGGQQFRQVAVIRGHHRD